MLLKKDIKTKWDLTPLLKEELTDELFKEKLRIYKKKNLVFVKKWRANKDYLRSPKVLKQALDEYSTLLENNYTSGTLSYYLSLRYYLNQTDSTLKGFLNKVEEFNTEISNQMTFFNLQLSKVSKKQQSIFLKSPILKDYKHYLSRLFKLSSHYLSEREENLINMLNPVSYANWSKLTKELLYREWREVYVTPTKKSKKSFEEILSLLSNKNKIVRDNAAKVFNSILSTWVDVAEREYNNLLQFRNIQDSLRGYKRPDEFRHISTDMDTKVVDTLIKSVTDNFNISKRYYKLKSRLFGVKKLAYHERNVPYGSLSSKITYTKAVNLVYTVFKNLDDDFGRIFKNFVTQGNIDVFPKRGKWGGAFCIHNLIKHPTYILLNYTSRIEDITTLAHEVGHGINNELMKKQNPLNFSSPLSTAEVASTFMEDFVLDFLERNLNEEEVLSLQMMRLNDLISTIFRQVAAYNFEFDTHTVFRKKGYLSKKELGDLFTKHMKSYMGNYVEQSPGSQNWWVYWSHFRTPFYVYTYASGLLISKYMQKKVKENPKFIKHVKEFLSAGSSDSPKNLFKKMGIDIAKKSFWLQGLKEIDLLLTKTEQLAKRLNKI